MNALYQAVIALHRKSQISRDVIPELQEAVQLAQQHSGNIVSDLVLELADAVDGGANDIGGHRGERTILNEAYQFAGFAALSALEERGS